MKLKFRYKDTDGLHYLTPLKYNGDLVMIDSKGKKYFVDENELDFFVGYDSDGKEVYEGDKLIEKGSRHEWEAILLPQAEMDCGGVYENLYNKKSAFKLKERGENEASDF